ncbi:dCTP deaminase [Blastochloris sulfoviridis]|uniref:dCTP deaminase n=1 Tax=Blastochloris sulfoviridis TaxID=50712 RepID=A0A5M6HZY1_9HYPH|nr:dCTP deaminase [Blastochloris sulfoviridis]KAA5601119.1 dCTP deaminase [Blastochloris sulfoviridis]
MILTDREIKNSLVSGLIEIIPLPAADAYSSTSVDLKLGPIIRVFKQHTVGLTAAIDPTVPGYSVVKLIENETEAIDISTSGYVLPGKTLILGWTREAIALHERGRVAARVEGKSSLARIGLAVHVTAPTIHAGFKAPSIQLEIVNHGPLPIRLSQGMPICQLIFEQTLGMPDKAYQGQFLGQTPT